MNIIQIDNRENIENYLSEIFKKNNYSLSKSCYPLFTDLLDDKKRLINWENHQGKSYLIGSVLINNPPLKIPVFVCPKCKEGAVAEPTANCKTPVNVPPLVASKPRFGESTEPIVVKPLFDEFLIFNLLLSPVSTKGIKAAGFDGSLLPLFSVFIASNTAFKSVLTEAPEAFAML